MKEGNINKGDEVVLENKYKGDIRYKDLGQYPGIGDIGKGRWVGVLGGNNQASRTTTITQERIMKFKEHLERQKSRRICM